MGKIKIIPPEIVSLIAAGEVIERPVYAVKELVENSLDAHANQITIDIRDGGLTDITVTDNGEGMESDDVRECFKLHATSKLPHQTLIGIKTLGFRGEALASIAAVATLIIQSKPHSDISGTKITLEGGKLIDITSVGMSYGTIVHIHQLFSNTPARRKFMKSITTEYKHILQYVTNAALSNPSVRFTFLHNQKTVFDLLPQKLEERIRILFGASIGDSLLALLYEDSYLCIKGFIVKPDILSELSSRQYLFVNNRAVSDRKITLAVKEAYGNLIESSSQPIFFLFISIPYEMVDVNIHPHKEAISFADEKFIFDSIYRSVSESLSKNNLTFANVSWVSEPHQTYGKLTHTEIAQTVKKMVLPVNSLSRTQITKSEDIVQFHNTYLLIESSGGIIFIDQHAAHERILYEQLLRAYKSQKQKQEILLLPKPMEIDLSVIDVELIHESICVFNKIGFTLEILKSGLVNVTAIPKVFQNLDIRQILIELLSDITEDHMLRDTDSQTKKMLSYLACRSAVKAGDPLTKAECRMIVDQLYKTNTQYTCPHGRPTSFEITMRQLELMFRRKK